MKNIVINKEYLTKSQRINELESSKEDYKLELKKELDEIETELKTKINLKDGVYTQEEVEYDFSLTKLALLILLIITNFILGGVFIFIPTSVASMFLLSTSAIVAGVSGYNLKNAIKKYSVAKKNLKNKQHDDMLLNKLDEEIDELRKMFLTSKKEYSLIINNINKEIKKLKKGTRKMKLFKENNLSKVKNNDSNIDLKCENDKSKSLKLN